MAIRGMKVHVLAAAVVVGAACLVHGADAPPMKLPFGSGDTLVAVRLKSINGAVKAVSELAAALDPQGGPMIAMQANQALGQLAGVDLDGPVAILLLDPKKYDVENGPVAIFTVKDAEAFNAWDGPDHKVVVGKLGIVGDNEEAVAHVAQYAKAAGLNAIPTRDMSDMLGVNTDLGGIVRRYKTEIDGGLQALKLQLGGMPGMGEAPPAEAQMGLKAIDYIAQLVDSAANQAGSLELGLSLDAKRITLRLAAEAHAGSDLAAFLAKLNRPADLRLAGYLPENASRTTIMSHDPEAIGAVGVGLVRIAFDVLGVDAAETKALCDALANVARSQTGLSASAEVQGTAGSGGVSLVGIKSPDAARAAAKALFELAQKGSVGAFLSKYGVAVRYTEKHRVSKNIPVDKLEIEFDFDKLLSALPVPDEAKPQMKQGFATALKAQFGNENSLVFEVVYGANLAATTYGPDLVALTDSQIDLMKSRGDGGIGARPEYKAALAQHPPTSFALSHISLFSQVGSMAQMMKSFMPADVGPGADMFPTRAELPAQEDPITASARVEGNRVIAQVFVPVSPINALVDVFKKKMMEQMMKNMPAPGADPMEEDDD